MKFSTPLINALVAEQKRNAAIGVGGIDKKRGFDTTSETEGFPQTVADLTQTVAEN